MDVLVNIVHQIRPVADGTPQEPLYVEGRPADPEHGNHDGYIRTKKRVSTTVSFWLKETHVMVLNNSFLKHEINK